MLNRLRHRLMLEFWDWLGWAFCEYAFRTDCRPGWPYDVGNWFYARGTRHWEALGRP